MSEPGGRSGIFCRLVQAGWIFPPSAAEIAGRPATAEPVCRWCGRPGSAELRLIQVPAGFLVHDWGELDPLSAQMLREYRNYRDRPAESGVRTLEGRQASARSDGIPARVAAVPADGPGLTRFELMSLWNLGERQTRDLARRLVDDGELVVEEVPSAHGGSAIKRYRSIS